MSFSDILTTIDENPYNADELTQLLVNSNELFVNQHTSDLERTLFQNEMLPPPLTEHQMVKVKQELPLVLAHPEPVSNDDYCGPYNFDVFFDPNHSSKNPWVYSAALKKIFILINKNFPVEFKCTPPDDLNLFVRATPVFSGYQYSQEIVVRCISHRANSDPSNKGLDTHIWEHIIRSTDACAMYCGDKEANRRLSLIVPLEKPQPGNDTVRKIFQFVCQNSCPTGMNRRAIELVFTLEDQDGRVFGRKVVNVRICSCPKRDKEKEEAEQCNKSGRAAPAAKKRKLEKRSMVSTASIDTKEYEVNIKVPGKEIYNTLMNVAHGLISGQIVKYGVDQPFKRYLRDLNQKMSQSE